MLTTATEFIMIDLMMRLGPEATSVTDWMTFAPLRLETAAEQYAQLATSYLDTQFAILSPAPPTVPPPDLSWVRDNIDTWLPAPMVEAAGRIADGENVTEVLNDIAPQVSREVTAFGNEVEARTVEDGLNNVGEVWTFDGNRPMPLEMDRIKAGIIEAEKYANSFRSSGYPLSKKEGKRLRIQIMPQIGACGFCIVRADRLYTVNVLQGSHVRSHNYCRCGWRIVTKDEANTFESALSGGRYKAVIDRRSSPDPNVPVQGDLTNE